MKTIIKPFCCLITLCLLSSIAVYAKGVPEKLPKPDGKAADMSKPVKVFILMGQSNMLGFGKLSKLKGIAADKYPYLVDENGGWTVRKDVRNVRMCGSGGKVAKLNLNDWLTAEHGIGRGKQIGPEIGIGHYLGEIYDEPVLLLKVCIGNRSLGYDLLPPSAPGYQGNKDAKPRAPRDGKWYGGIQYDGDVMNALNALKEIGTYYPGTTKYEVAGFFFWQGAKDSGNKKDSANYETNLVHLIKDLRKDFNAPKAFFVCATMGHAKKGNKITDAQLAVDGETGKYPEFKGNVGSFYSHPVSKGGGANGHYGGNPETYMNVGEGMGKTMARLIVNSGTLNSSSTAAAPPVGVKPRIWKDYKGNTLEATFIKIEDGRVFLKAKKTGKVIRVKRKSLVEADQSYLKEIGQ